MRSLICIAAVFCGQLAFGQVGPVSIGAKIGVPLTDAFDTRVELRLPHGFGVEFDALYNRLNYDSYFFAMTPSSGRRSYFTSTRADRWNFPILLKWHQTSVA